MTKKSKKKELPNNKNEMKRFLAKDLFVLQHSNTKTFHE